MPATLDGLRLPSPGSGETRRLRPRLRVRPAPALEPPLDGEVDRQPIGMDLLPVASPVFARSTGATLRPAGNRPIGRTDPTRGRDTGLAPEQEGGCSGATVARRFVSLCAEVINGFRPAAQLRPLIVPHRFASVIDQITRRSARPGPAAPDRRLARIRRVHLCEPVVGVVEAAVVLDNGDRCWAMALRLERQPVGWRCVVVQVI